MNSWIEIGSLTMILAVETVIKFCLWQKLKSIDGFQGCMIVNQTAGEKVLMVFGDKD